MSKRNNADAKFINCYAFMEYEEVDADQEIWRGKPVDTAGIEHKWVYFSRKYSPDNDMDKMLHEYEILDESIFGVVVLLVPREKLLFMYNPPTAIVIVPHKISRKMGGI